MAHTVKCLPAMWETWVRSLAQADSLEKEMSNHSSILAHGQRRLVGCSLWGSKESDMTEVLHFHFHTVKGFSIVNATKADVFLEFPCFFYDPADHRNFISGFSAFSKSSFNIWKFSVHVLLKLSLKDF